MRKSDKKTEKIIIAQLTLACDQLLEEVEGFEWLTHFCDYSDVAGSLAIVCVFDTNEHLAILYQNDSGDKLRALLVQQLQAAGIEILDSKGQISFDTEEACQKEHDGKWKHRFK